MFRSNNIVARIFERQIRTPRPATSVHFARQFYENLVPSYTIYDVECPDHSFRKFTDDGLYLISFSRNHQELIVYRPSWLSFSCKGQDCDNHYLSMGAKRFENFFTELYCMSLASSNELICKDFFLYMERNQVGLFATSTAQIHDAPATGGAVKGVPSIEMITFHLIRLEDGVILDEKVFHNDFINLAHNTGVFLYDDLLAIVSLRYQTIHILQIRDHGNLVDVRAIGAFCREDDELFLNSNSQLSKEKYIELARKSGNFNEAIIKFQQRVLKHSGLGDETYLPHPTIFHPGFKNSLKDGREEAAAVIFGAVDNLLDATRIKAGHIRILIINCSTLNTTPSLCSMVINHYKLRHNTISFNLGGMGCAAGMIAIDLAHDLLGDYPGSYALIVSTEIVSLSWYTGNEVDMVIPNCFLRMGSAAVLLSSHRLDRWKAKYLLKQLVRTHKGMDNRSFNSIYLKEDAEGRLGLSANKEVIEVGGHALKDNITSVGPLVLSFTEQIRIFSTLVSKYHSKPYTPNYKLAFEHICILATSKKVLDQIQRNLGLTEEYMEASRKTLERFGNTSSSSVWYELAYLEASGKVKKGDRIWQIAFGSGLKCNSTVWKALCDVGMPKKTLWIPGYKLKM